jgi:hypothetical protein
MFETLSQEDVVGGVLIVENNVLFAKLPDGRKVRVYAEVDGPESCPYLMFETY